MGDSVVAELPKENGNNVVQLLHEQPCNKPENRYRKRKKSVYKYLIIISGSLLCTSFGVMLGWPSPSYPLLLNANSTIPINLDQSAMIAGMLMNGFVLATPLACCSCLTYKTAAILSSTIALIGWFVLAGAKDVLALCISRLLVGASTGYGAAKYKGELKNICDPSEVVIYKNLAALCVNFGVCLTFAVGPLVAFRTLAVLAVPVPAIAILMMFGTKKPKEETGENAEQAMNLTEREKDADEDDTSAIKYNKLVLLLLLWLMILQQFSGGPPFIVYSQIIFTEMGCPYASICAAVYSIIFLLSTYVGLWYTPRFKHLPILLVSYTATFILSTLNLLYFWYKPTNPYLFLLPFFSMQLFCFFHTAGATSVMGPLVSDMFPQGTPKFVENYVVMCTAELAVIVTKVFQVLYDRYEMAMPFCMLAATSLAGMFTVAIYLRETKIKKKSQEILTNT